jgi:hypothetical protein
LAQALGVDIGMRTSPALLLRYACSASVTDRILRMPGLELRQAQDHTLLVASSYPQEAGDAAHAKEIGEEKLATMQAELDLPPDVCLLSAEIDQRPTFGDDLPRLGYLPQVEGVIWRRVIPASFWRRCSVVWRPPKSSAGSRQDCAQRHRLTRADRRLAPVPG